MGPLFEFSCLITGSGASGRGAAGFDRIRLAPQRICARASETSAGKERNRKGRKAANVGECVALAGRLSQLEPAPSSPKSLFLARMELFLVLIRKPQGLRIELRTAISRICNRSTMFRRKIFRKGNLRDSKSRDFEI